MDLSIGITLGINGPSIPDFSVSIDEEFKVGDNPSFTSAEAQKALQVVAAKLVNQVTSLTGHGPAGFRASLVYEDREAKPRLHSPNIVESAPVPDRGEAARWRDEAEKWKAASTEGVEQAARIQKMFDEVCESKRKEVDRAYVEGFVDATNGETSKVDLPLDLSAIQGEDEHGKWFSKHWTAYRASETVLELEDGNPTQNHERQYLDEENEGQLKKNPWSIPPKEPFVGVSSEEASEGLSKAADLIGRVVRLPDEEYEADKACTNCGHEEHTGLTCPVKLPFGPGHKRCGCFTLLPDDDDVPTE